MQKRSEAVLLALLSVALAGCDPEETAETRAPALNDAAWAMSEWISAKDAPVADDATKKSQLAAEGTSWFLCELTSAKPVAAAKWMTTALGVFELYVNGKRVGKDALKPGFTQVQKTRRSFTYDVTEIFAREAGAKNVLAAEVSAGWWRDKIVNYYGKKSAFRSVLELTYSDGSKRYFGTNLRDWKAGVGGPVLRAGIFDGEICDARVAVPAFGDAAMAQPEANGEFAGEILPSAGGEVCRRYDLARRPVWAYRWKDVAGANGKKGKEAVFGKVVRTWTARDPAGTLEILPGETLVVDFGQNCAGVPAFEFAAAAGTVLTCLPGEMLNDANGERSRGNDGPAGSVYRENLRMDKAGMRAVYTFAGAERERYMPRFSFFGYRYLSLAATARVRIGNLFSVPVTSIAKEMELGKIVTGDKSVNRLIANAYWGQLSNYLSVPTDCPQRNERLGWSADTQVFTEAGSFNANTLAFFRKWTRDLRDNQHEDGTYTAVAPYGQYGNNSRNVAWADAGVIVPWTVWKQFGDTSIVEENFAAMERWMAYLDRNGYVNRPGDYQYGDWLSFESYESWLYSATHGWQAKKDWPKEMFAYWDYLCGCYWIYDAKLMAEMSAAIGKKASAARYAATEAWVRESVRTRFLDAEGRLPAFLRKMQTPYVMALKMGLFRNEKERRAGIEALLANIRANGNRISTGFIGASFILDVLTEAGHPEVAYTLLLQHENPSWLYSVDQGATTIWERWDGYVKNRGFGPVGMNSFNHYAYGAVVAWIYKSVAGIAADSSAPGYRRILMAPKPDRRLGSAEAEYRTPHGLVKSAWKYEGERWIWSFTVPAGATARVTLPGGTVTRDYGSGDHTVMLMLD